MSSDIYLNDDDTVSIIGLAGVRIVGPLKLDLGSAKSITKVSAPSIPGMVPSGMETHAGLLGGGLGGLTTSTATAHVFEAKKVFKALEALTETVDLAEHLQLLRLAILNLNERLRSQGY